MRDLVVHTGGVHRQKELVVREHLKDDDFEFERPQGDLLDWFSDGAAMLVKTLASAEAKDPCWTWFGPDQTVGFWQRRMAHETLIHRVDAELAHGAVTDIDPVLAEDGIDEALVAFIEGYPAWADLERATSVIMLSTGLRQWYLREATFSGTTRSGRVLSDVPTVLLENQPAYTVCEISGSPASLDFWLWGRAPLSKLSVTGDESHAMRLRDVAAAST